MIKEQKKIKFLDERNNEIESSIELFRGKTSRIIFYEPINIEFESSDFFEALIKSRHFFESHNFLILCNGARKDVCASGMSRSMGGGRYGVIIEMGKQASMENMVDIFDYAYPSLIASVEEQANYYEEWVNALKILLLNTDIDHD